MAGATPQTEPGGPDLFVPPGHFYSPITDAEMVARDADRIFDAGRALAGVELNTEAQLALLQRLGGFYPEMPFSATESDGLLYYFENPFYSYADGLVYYAMLREFRPRRVVEVGSGFSSALTLDVNARFFDGALDLTFIEPYPEVLDRLLAGRAMSAKVINERVQDVDPGVFRALADGDFLFIDSTHVSKTGSDVNHLFFDVLPSLPSGVFVHVHDVFYPFEYPRPWVLEGRSWNEQYLLHAFLQYNSAFEIAFFTTYLAERHPEAFYAALPLARENPGGSIWLRRR